MLTNPKHTNQLLKDLLAKRAELQAPDDTTITEPTKAQDSTQTAFLSRTIAALLSQQTGNEYFAHYTYRGAANWFDAQGFDGFKAWCLKQAADELGHADKIINYLTRCGYPVYLPALCSPPLNFTNVLQACRTILEHEKSVTASWREIGQMALAEGDVGTVELAGWFVNEQMEEEDKAMKLCQKVERAVDINVLDLSLAD